MIQQLETTLRSGVVPHAPQLWPPTQVETSRSTVSVNKSVASSRYNSTTSEVKVEEGKGKVKSEDQDNRVPPAVKLTGAQEPSSVNRVEGDHLGDA
ncbi:hypothetical protein Vadar_022214 [Vaccinium darrowii]|uniref:Uncharacterized protein n=1 Tax=Vaccinium darrowii TaxID=229202 RepID=A0ACB7XBH7_9ERIC|nr:hypothetical protein Vadar_022214 [Vaccinium darrowii]